MEESFISNNIEKLHKIGKKIIHLKHHIKYLEVCILYKVTPQGLRIKKIPSISPFTTDFRKDWDSILETSEEQLSRRVLMESESNVKHRINEFYGIFVKVLETEDPITDVEQLLVSFIDLEDKLFNRRVTKFLKIFNEINLNQMRREMVTENHFSKEIQKHFEDKKLIQSSITTSKQRKPTKELKKRSAIPSETIPSPPLSPSPILPLDLSSSSTSVHDITQFAEILADLEKDAIPPAHRNFVTTANTETTSRLNFCETDKTSNRLVGIFISSSVVNLSRRNVTSAEIELLEKGLSFVPMPEKKL